jgi:hypothetical protein
MPTAIHDNPKEAVESYIRHLETAYYKWYARSVKRNFALWVTLQTVALVAGIATAVLAALLKEKIVSGDGVAWVFVILPLISSVASSVVAQSRVYDRWRLREYGRAEFQNLATKGRQRFASINSSSGYAELHDQLRKDTHEIEKAQGKGFFALGPSFTK